MFEHKGKTRNLGELKISQFRSKQFDGVSKVESPRKSLESELPLFKKSWK